MLKKFFKSLTQKGQVLVFYALMVPTLFLFVSAAADFGWWYFNQSRLQNAADAAALAGAGEIAATKYNPVVDFVNEVPKGLSQNVVAGEVETLAKKYADDNFLYAETSDEVHYNSFENYSYSNADYNPLYYVVELKGQATHLFKIAEQFGDMPLKVVAVARIADFPGGEDPGPPPGKENPTNPTVTEQLEDVKSKNVIIGNWEVQNKYRTNTEVYKKIYGRDLFTGKWNHFRTPDKTITNSGKRFREENLIVKNGSSYTYATPANGNKKYAENELESINIDFTQDVSFNLKSDKRKALRDENGKTQYYFTEDWDIGDPLPASVSSITEIYEGSKTQRTHSVIDFDAPYKKRTGQAEPDVLFARIESEPMWSNLGFKTILTLNTVRQIILNINASNTGTQYRPLVIFYDGPETNAINPNLTEEERASVVPRKSQPVILNLNSDFNGILYAPNSPVVFNPNGYKFKGFIVAKEYLSVKTESDFESEMTTTLPNDDETTLTKLTKSVENGNIIYKDSEGVVRRSYTKTVIKGNNVIYVNERGDVQYKTYEGSFNYGTFENFGRTELNETFFIRGEGDSYVINKDSGENLLTVPTSSS